MTGAGDHVTEAGDHVTGAGDHVTGARQSIHHATGTKQLEVKSSNQVAKGQSTMEESRPPRSVEAGITVTANLSDGGMVPCCEEGAALGGERAPDATRQRVPTQGDLAVAETQMLDPPLFSSELPGGQPSPAMQTCPPPQQRVTARDKFKVCENCHVEISERIRVCSGCKRVAYCNSTCQKDHWKTHKQACSYYLKKDVTG